MEPAMNTFAQRCTMVLLAALAALAALGAVATSTGHAAPGTRPWLEVKLPPAPAAGAATARLELDLESRTPAQAEYTGVKLSVGGAPAREVRLGERVVLPIAASATQPLRLEIGGMRVLAHVQPGDKLAVRSGHDGGWIAVIGNRMNENAPKSLTQCGGKARKTGACPAGYASAHVYKGDGVCPAGPDDETVYKCVKAPVVRARGPLSGPADVTNASADGNLDELDTVPLAAGPLAAGALGPAITVAIGGEMMPHIRLGGAEAMLVVGPGQSYQVWLDDQGRIDSARAK
jgi:hypothetical protein